MSAASQDTPIVVDMWFDPMCPWAWLTSRWILEAVKVRDIDLRFHIMSLAVLNEGKDIPSEYVDMMSKVWGPVRVVAAAQKQFGPEITEPLYTAISRRIFVDDRRDDPTVIVDALAELNLPAELADAVSSKEFDDAIRASHQASQDAAAMEIGTPVMAINGMGYFGPVISPAPKGEAAGRLFDGIVLLSGSEGFYEIKRARTQPPAFD